MVKKTLLWTTLIVFLVFLTGCGPAATEVTAPPTKATLTPTLTRAAPPTAAPQPIQTPPEAVPPPTGPSQPEPAQPAVKRVVLIIAHKDFRDEEYSEPRTALESRGFQLTVASSSLETATGMLGTRVKPDILVSDIVVDDYAAIVFVGGVGAAEYWDDPIAHRIAQEAVAQGKVLAAICIAPVTLARAGVLQGKRATVFASETDKVQAGGATCTSESVVRDGLIITANGPGAARQFGETIAAALEEQG